MTDRERLARAQFEARRKWRAEIGEKPQPAWEETPKNVTEIYFRDVDAILAEQQRMAEEDPLPELQLDSIYIRALVKGKFRSRCLTDLHGPSVEAWLERHCQGDPEGAQAFLIRVIESLWADLRMVGEEWMRERSLYADDPDDRLYHAADRTWWRRRKDGMLTQAQPPEGWAERADYISGYTHALEGTPPAHTTPALDELIAAGDLRGKPDE